MKTPDYLIIGAGAAGSLLANRLSADASVLLVEAGGRDWNPLIRVPLLAGFLYYLPALNWGYATTPQSGLDGRVIAWPRGRVLGGSTAINGMMYIRGHRSDYDAWEDQGLTGWGYDAVLPFFKAFERNLSHPAGDAFHGRHGELITEKARACHPIYDVWLDAARQAGFRSNSDFNGADQEGVGVYDFNIANGRRVSAASAFLAPVLATRRLSIATRTVVTRLLFEGTRCVGAEAIRRGRRVLLKARREVIVCAGAVNSPALLQHSGIGAGDLLTRLGIKMIADRPEVGSNLQDHLGVYVQHRCLQPITLYSLMRPDRALWAGARALFFGRGPASSIPLEVGGFLRTRPELPIPDAHVTAVPGLSLAATQKGQFEHGFLTNIYQLRPRSRGYVRICSRDPLAAPEIEPRYLSAEEDLRCLRDGVRLVRRIHQQSALDRYRGTELAPGEEIESDAQIDSWIRGTAGTIFHPVGTCRLGADNSSVVDPQLRVRGVQGLRVADASVMPTIIGGNTSAPTMMIAERAAAFIRGGSQPSVRDFSADRETETTTEGSR
jgi:choline dehydrogenase